MNYNKQITKKHRDLFSVLLFVLFFLISAPAFCSSPEFIRTKEGERQGGVTDSTKYDINDPRNPNCPCHQYQKIAEEEYQKSQKDLSQNHVVSEIELSKAINNSSSSAGISSGKSKHKRNYIQKFFFKMNSKVFGKHKHWKKSKMKMDKCFIWM